MMTTKEQILEKVQQNHIWINAFTLIRPSDEVAKSIGYAIINMLKDKDNLLPAYYGEDASEKLEELAKLTPELYLRINAS